MVSTRNRLVDELLEEHAELARQWLEDFREAVDTEGQPLDAEALASLDRGLADLERANPL
jgi:hypothetical protein